jgi:hypothetical protein
VYMNLQTEQPASTSKIFVPTPSRSTSYLVRRVNRPIKCEKIYLRRLSTVILNSPSSIGTARML